MAAETTPPGPTSPELAAKLNEAAIAEAEARIEKARKESADARKAAEAASNPAILRAEQEKAQAEAEKATAEAEKARLAATLPTSTSKPLEGKIEVDSKVGYFTQILAHRSTQEAATSIAQQVAAQVKNKPIATIYLVKQSDYLQGATQLKEIEDRLALFDKAFEVALERYPEKVDKSEARAAGTLTGLAAIPAVVGVLADVAAMFRVDRNLAGRDTTVTDDSLLAALAGALKTHPDTKDVIVIRPGLNATPSTTLVTKLQALREKAERVATRAADIRGGQSIYAGTIERTRASIGTLQADLTALVAAAQAERTALQNEIKLLADLAEKAAPDSDERKRLHDAVATRISDLASRTRAAQDAIDDLRKNLSDSRTTLEGPEALRHASEFGATQLETLVSTFTAFTTRLVSVADGANASPLAQLAEIAALRDCPDNARILAVAVTGQGGELETRKSIWTSGRVYHRAGIACAFTLFGKDGKITDAGLVVANQQTREGTIIESQPPKSGAAGRASSAPPGN